MQFSLTLKNEKTRQYRTIRDLIVVLNFIAFIALLVMAATNQQKITLVIGLLVCSTYLFFLLLELFNKKSYRQWLPNLFPLLALVWFRYAFWWGGIVILLLFLLDKLAARKLTLLFSNDSIRFPSVPARKINWAELNNVILKDGLLTLDFKNNKLLQVALLTDEKNPNEEIFNDFCRTQLRK